jgi:hypothetical protein
MTLIKEAAEVDISRQIYIHESQLSQYNVYFLFLVF